VYSLCPEPFTGGESAAPSLDGEGRDGVVREEGAVGRPANASSSSLRPAPAAPGAGAAAAAATASGSAAVTDPPPPPKTVMEALEQRLAKFQSAKENAEAEGNSRKARQ
jgi:hypothetical protein